jgi:hypothetical protein
MSVIQPVKMVEICFMNERVSPTGQDGKKLTPLAAQLVKKNPNCQEVYSHGVHETAK